MAIQAETARPRIALVSSNYPQREAPDRGLFIFNTAGALAHRAGVRVYCPVADYPRWEWMQPRRYRYCVPDLAYGPGGAAVEYFSYPAFPLLTRPFNHVSIRSRLLPRLLAGRPDAVLAFGLYPDGLAAVLAANRLGIPAIVGARGSDLHSIPGPVVRSLTRRTLRLAARVLTVSSDLAVLAASLGAVASKIHTVRNGCDASTFRPRSRQQARALLGCSPEDRLVLFAGRFHPVKGISDLLEAFALIAGPDPRLRLALAGDGHLRQQIAARASALGLADRVHFPGACSPDAVAAWMAACDVFCLPSLAEGCPNVVLEALACGRPVVASDIAGIAEIVAGSNSILVPPRNPTRLAGALREALQREWDEAGIAASSTRAWDDVAAETMEVCRLAIADHGSHN